ncbi:Formate dehydrogenase, cytochrome b556(fdo) subunit [Phycisphaerales bacterium]|nr:Formate dehydrogenase, cytochrome b556(fdo) subunit [Phycisphaerales bacterium]
MQGANRVARAVVLTAALVGAGRAFAQPADADSDRRCMQCHGQAHIAELSPRERRAMVGTWLDVSAPAPGPGAEAPLIGNEPERKPGLFVMPDALAASPHANVRCVECHDDAAKLPHAPTLEKATCATTCHAEAAQAYEGGVHHEALLKKDPLAPTCASCHGGHEILRVKDRNAPQHHLNSLFLCGDCHKQHSPTATDADPAHRVADYLDSTHARAITKAGVPFAATCADCHGAHAVRRANDPESAVHRSHIPETCGKCHIGIAEVYDQSVHGRKHTETNGKTAVCTDCHTAHQITLASSPKFMLDVINECGRCHDSPDASGDRVGTYYQTYGQSYHGQVSRLGTTRAARCADCHGSHDILPLNDPQSRVAGENLVQTCAKCHPGSNAKFVQFDPHANHRDAKNYPILHGVWLYFMILMSTVFGFFGLHTILWFIRSMVDRVRHGPPPSHAKAPTAIRRFTTLHRINHLLVATTFFGLTATGIPLVFAGEEWARRLAKIAGGVQAAGLWHRFFAVLLIINLILHFAGLTQAFFQRTCSWKDWLFGSNSLLPRWRDVKDGVGMFRWFLGLGKKPSLDRWTYWEKFDYWAEVGGSFIIGGSGLLLWFPEQFARIAPGWLFNVAMIVHGYEALLAIGFIFTIHFFNAHLRPGTFPVDEVMFTGSLPEHELKEQRPDEYRRLVDTGRLESLRVTAPDPRRRPAIIAITIVSVSIGLVLLGFIIAGGLS